MVEEGPTGPDAGTATSGGHYGILADVRRCYALYCLDRFQTPVPLADLADEVAILEHDVKPITRIPGEDVKRIYMDLYHAQIPKMVDSGLVTYDQESDMVDLASDLTELKLEECIDSRQR